MGWDILGGLLGKAVRRQLEKELAQKSGPVLEAIKPALTSIVVNYVETEVPAKVAPVLDNISTVIQNAQGGYIGGANPKA